MKSVVNISINNNLQRLFVLSIRHDDTNIDNKV